MLKFAIDLTVGSMKLVDCICDYCGKEFKLPNRNRIKGYKVIKKDACINCRAIKRKESCLIKYGTNTVSQNKHIRRNISKTKGGNGINIEDYKDQILNLYNSHKHMSILYIAKKLNLPRTTLRKYMKKLNLDVTGDRYKKTQRTMREKYGVDYFLQCSQGQKKFKQSMKVKYGVDSIYKDQKLKEKFINKSKETCLQRYGIESVINDPKRQNEFQAKRRLTRIKNGNEIEYEGKTAQELAKNIGINLSSFHERVKKLGLEKAIKTNKYSSCLENIMSSWLDSINIQYKTQFYVGNKIADFYIPEYNIIIEVDGLYWHSDAIIKDKYYHVQKRKLYIDNNYIPLFFRADEINSKFKIVKSIILHKLNRTICVGARQCDLVKLSKDQGKQFIKNNHLMGVGKGLYYGLVYRGDIISIICIKKICDNDYEISRFCSKINYSVNGAFSRLLKFVQSEISMDTLTTFIDLRYGSGNYLSNFGFKFMTCYPSFKWTDSHKTFYRMKFPGNTGYSYGCSKIWDCGQAKWNKIY